jgi:transposase, IS30 family
MPKIYKQLSIEERETIQMGVWQKKSIRSIAKELGRSPATISRELKRNCPSARRVYTPRVAQEKAENRIKARAKRCRLKNPLIREYVVAKLKASLSPEQIAGRLSVDNPKFKISHEAIYQYIYSQYHRSGYGDCIGDDLRIYLKRRHKVRHRKYVPFRPQRLKIKDAVSINERPRSVDLRKIIGHWEGDSVISRQSKAGLNTLVERKSGLVFISKIENGTARVTADAVVDRFKELPPNRRQTLTLDNGSENSGHKIITEKLGTKCYFANPYHSWERGSNENTNGLIRYYLPKKTDFKLISNEQIKQIENALNNRPRKRLKWLTPLEVFNGRVLR